VASRLFQYKGTDTDREKMLKMVKGVKECIEHGECKKALFALRALCGYTTVAQAEALGILEDLVEIINEYKARCNYKEADA